MNRFLVVCQFIRLPIYLWDIAHWLCNFPTNFLFFCPSFLSEVFLLIFFFENGLCQTRSDFTHNHKELDNIATQKLPIKNFSNCWVNLTQTGMTLVRFTVIEENSSCCDVSSSSNSIRKRFFQTNLTFLNMSCAQSPTCKSRELLKANIWQTKRYLKSQLAPIFH